jgi:hypothetical protein
LALEVVEGLFTSCFLPIEAGVVDRAVLGVDVADIVEVGEVECVVELVVLWGLDEVIADVENIGGFWCDGPIGKPFVSDVLGRVVDEAADCAGFVP